MEGRWIGPPFPHGFGQPPHLRPRLDPERVPHTTATGFTLAGGYDVPMRPLNSCQRAAENSDW